MKTNDKQREETERTPIKLFSMKQVAQMWGLSYWCVRDMVLDGKLKPIVGVGRGFKFTGFELREDMLERL